ncbi:outer membrane beta-barrel protein [Flaviaesturariibacter terrae]
MRKILLSLLLLTGALASGAQFRVTGSLRDTTSRSNPALATVTLLQKKDSTLVTFTRTDSAGRFRTAEVPPGSYVLLITYPRFADLAEPVEIRDADVSMGQLALTPKSRLLQEIIIRTNAAIRIKGDTTEFAADSFRVKDGATVEDLLKRLPGFSVNAKGEITTQGKRVDKVLVDGEEFFGDDPTMATQNLSAKIVEKVQVYDTKTEQENMRSVGSASEGKTLNIKLKEDKKKGGFGNAQVGTDFNRFLEARTMLNRFVGKKKVSVYANRSNVNTGSLSWNDRNKLGIENNVEYDELNGYYYSFSSDDGFSDWNLKGYPDAWIGGALFTDKWNRDRQNINLSYRYNQLGNVNNSVSTSQNVLPGNRSFRYRDVDNRGVTRQHTINAKYEWKIDSLTSIKYTVAGTFRSAQVNSHTYSHFLNDAGDTVNVGLQDRYNDSKRNQLDQQLTWRQMFMKKGRLLITTLRHGLVQDEQRGWNRSDNYFYMNRALDSTVDQMRTVDGKSQSFGVKSSFNEPLSKTLNLVLEYGYNSNRSESYRNTFSKSTNGKYENLDTVFSSNFELDAFSHNGSMTLKYVDKKWRVAAGSGLSDVTLRLHNLFAGSTNAYHFRNVTPQVGINYSPKPQTSIGINYRGNTRQPTIDQLQPIRDNNDPLNVFIGNPNLKVGFNNSINASFSKSKPLKNIWMYASLSYNINQNDIAFKNELDTATGKQTYQPVNVNGNRSWWAWANYSKDGGNKKWSRAVQIGGNGSRNHSFFNGLANVSTYANINVNPNVSYRWDEHFNFEVGPEVNYNISHSSLQPGADANYFTYGGRVEGSAELPFKLQLNIEGDFEVRQGVTGFSSAPSNYLVNGSLIRKFFKDNSLLLKLTVNDLFNQNVGFNRNFNTNILNEERYNRIARYFMLRVEWQFSKMGTGAASK